mgnify:CR=1 FL=1
MKKSEKLLRPRDAAELVGVCIRTLHRWAQQGWLTRHHCGARSTRFFASEVYAAAARAAADAGKEP